MDRQTAGHQASHRQRRASVSLRPGVSIKPSRRLQGSRPASAAGPSRRDYASGCAPYDGPACSPGNERDPAGCIDCWPAQLPGTGGKVWEVDEMPLSICCRDFPGIRAPSTASIAHLQTLQRLARHTSRTGPHDLIYGLDFPPNLHSPLHSVFLSPTPVSPFCAHPDTEFVGVIVCASSAVSHSVGGLLTLDATHCASQSLLTPRPALTPHRLVARFDHAACLLRQLPLMIGTRLT